MLGVLGLELTNTALGHMAEAVRRTQTGSALETGRETLKIGESHTQDISEKSADQCLAGVPESGQTLTIWAGRAYHARATLKTRE